jgi:hypothetical protein
MKPSSSHRAIINRTGVTNELVRGRVFGRIFRDYARDIVSVIQDKFVTNCELRGDIKG